MYQTIGFLMCLRVKLFLVAEQQPDSFEGRDASFTSGLTCGAPRMLDPDRIIVLDF